MRSKKTFTVDENDKEIAAFLERLRVAGELSVEVGGVRYVLTMSRSDVGREGRSFLASGGPDGLEE
jgi:hypothetical protein